MDYRQAEEALGADVISMQIDRRDVSIAATASVAIGQSFPSYIKDSG